MFILLWSYEDIDYVVFLKHFHSMELGNNIAIWERVYIDDNYKVLNVMHVAVHWLLIKPSSIVNEKA